MQRELARVAVDAGDRGREPAAAAPTSARMLDDHLAGPTDPGQLPHRHLTVCTMVPMRSVPHRVVCLLGLDDGVFPRPRHRSTATTCSPARRSPASATSAPRTASCCSTRSAPRPRRSWSPTPAPTSTAARPGRPPYPSASCSTPSTAPPRRRCATRSSSGTRCSPSTCATSSRAGSARPRRSPSTPDAGGRDRRDRAAAGTRRRSSPAAGRAGRAAPVTDDVALADLVAFFRDPVKGFFRALDAHPAVGRRRRSPTRCPSRSTSSRPGASATGCSPTCCAASTPTGAREIEWRRGALPPGQLGWRKATEVRETGDEPRRRRAHPPPGRPAGLRRRRRPRAAAAGSPAPSRRVYGDRLVAVGYSRLDGKHLLESWVRLLALAGRAPRPQLDRADDRPAHRAAPRPRSGCSARPTRSRSACSPTWSHLYDEGRRAPLPLPLKTSFAWASARAHRGRTPSPRRRRSGGPAASPARTPTRPTSGSGASTPTSTTCSPSCRRAWRERLVVRRLLDERAGAAVSDRTLMEPFDLLGDAARRADHDRARGQRRHRQDLRPGRAWSPATSPRARALLDDMLLITFGRAASQELRERVRDQLVAAAEALDDPAAARRRPARPTWSPGPTTSWPSAAATCATRWPASTPRPSPPPTSSASWCCARSASPATPTPASRWSRTSTSWWPRSSTTSTSSASAT